jgi:hypothetical protein
MEVSAPNNSSTVPSPSSSGNGTQSANEVFAGLIIQFVMAAVVVFASITFFETVRRHYDWIYAPKYASDSAKIVSKPQAKKRGGWFRSKKEPLSKSADVESGQAAEEEPSLSNPGHRIFSWVSPTLMSSDSVVTHYAGLDATMFTKFLLNSSQYHQCPVHLRADSHEYVCRCALRTR